MKNYLWQIISGVLLIVLLFRCCEDPSKDKSRTIIIPEKKGSFTQVKPESIKVPIYHYKTLKGDTITLENPVNEELALKYETLIKNHDSIKAKLMYLEAIQIRNYKHEFEDKNLKATVYARTTGTLDSLKLDYTIKPDTIIIPEKKLLVSLLLGGGLNTVDKGGVKLNVGVQTKRGDVVIGGYDIINKGLFLDYNFKIFTINK